MNVALKDSTGTYGKQFDLEANPQNTWFVQNPYRPNKCHVSDIVCFSLINGAMACSPDQSLLMGYDVAGKIVKVQPYSVGFR